MVNRLIRSAMVAVLIVAIVGLYHFAVALVALGGTLASLAFIGWCLALGFWIEARKRRHWPI
jgi:hypothetical protein